MFAITSFSFFLRIRQPPRATRTHTRCPSTTLVRSFPASAPSAPADARVAEVAAERDRQFLRVERARGQAADVDRGRAHPAVPSLPFRPRLCAEIGRASCRERVCQYV